MAQLDGMHRQGETQRTPSSPTVEQFLRAGEGSRWAPRALQPFSKEHHDMEDDHIQHRKSVLAKVKEKARKWRNTLSKKKHSEDVNTTPSWGVSLEDVDDEDEDEDPEYLGAPMYESEMAPEGYKETARQHPRTIPVISENHVLAKNIDTNTSDQKSPTYNEKSPVLQRSLTFNIPKTISETVVEKLAPAYATVTEATYAIASKIQSLTLSNPETQAQEAPKLAPIATKQAELAPTEMEKIAPGSAPAGGTGEQIWDKGVSVKEYLMHKLEPGEDEKALSQVISEVMSPRKTTSDATVVEKVREAVTSFLRNDESSKPPICHSAHNSSSSFIPISTNAHEVVEEETHGRILQAN